MLRTLLATLLKLAVAAAGQLAAVAVIRSLLLPLLTSALSLDPDTSSIVRRAGIFAAGVFFYWGFVLFYERRKATELAPRPRWTLLAGMAGALSIGVTILALFATGNYQVLSYRGFGAAGGVFCVIGIAAVLEGVAFRCILFRIVEERYGTRNALAVSALVFSVAHIANNGFDLISLITVTLAGGMWAGVFILSRNLWVTAAHHLFWNATIFVIGLPLSGEEEWRARAPFVTAYRGANWLTGGAFGPENSVINILVSGAVCYGLYRMIKNQAWRPPRMT